MNVPVVFISDDNYIIPTSVAIASMISSRNVDTHYDIYIVCASLSQESEETFSVFASDVAAIHIVREDANRFANLHTFEDSSMCVASPAALLKFALPEIFTEYDRILYLDGDILVRCDLSELYATELGNDLLAAVMDSSALYKPQYQFVPDYFNSGVMLLNLRLMREENIKESLIQAKLENNVAYFMDQNAFNHVCTGRVHLLPIRYNLLAVILDKAKQRWTVKNINQYYGTTYASQSEVLEGGSIIHFASKDKPWKNPFVRYANEWFDVYRSIPVAHTLPDYPKIMDSISITVSLTSYPARIYCVPDVIDCLSVQTVLPDRVALYLAKEQFPMYDSALPERLREQIAEEKVEIHWCDLDLKSHKKYFYAMQEYPDDLIITVDDDEYLPETVVEELAICWLHCPDAVSARRTNLITFDRNNRILPYQNWIIPYNALVQTPSMQLMPTGCSGVLYPPHLLPPEMFDAQAIMECAPFGDDLWLKAHEVMSDIPVVLATDKTSLRHVEGSQENGLYLENQFSGGNDTQLENVCHYIDEVYCGRDLLQSKIYASSVGTNLTSVETLVAFIEKIRKTLHSKERSLRKANAKNNRLNQKLRTAWDEKRDRGVQIRRLTKKNNELQSKLKITYDEKYDRGVQIRALEKQQREMKKELSASKKQLSALKKENAALKKKNKAMKQSTIWKVGRVVTWPGRKLKRLLKKLRKK